MSQKKSDETEDLEALGIPLLPTSPKRLRIGFLVVGIVLLILSFSFFYWASRANWDYVTVHSDTVNLADSTYLDDFFSSYGYPQWGNCYDYFVRGGIIMQLNDIIRVSFPESGLNGTVHLVLMKSFLWGNTGNYSAVAYSDSGTLVFTNNQPYVYHESFDIRLAFENRQNATITVTTQLNHYETPQWVYFGVGILFSSLAMIPIFKSKK
jgi:hypothetical protein